MGLKLTLHKYNINTGWYQMLYLQMQHYYCIVFIALIYILNTLSNHQVYCRSAC